MFFILDPLFMFESKTQTMKKIFVTMMGITLGVGSMFAQDGGSSKWIGTLGVAPVIIDGTGLQLGFEKAVSNKLSVGLGLNSLTRKAYTDNYPLGNSTFPNGLQSSTNPMKTNTFGLNARYYIIGNNQDAKFGLYGGLGLGLSTNNYSSSSKNLLPETDSNYYSYDYESNEKGLSALIMGGFDTKLSKGRLFLEVQSISLLTSTDTRITSNGKGTMASQNGTYESKDGSFLFWDAYITIGYRMRF